MARKTRHSFRLPSLHRLNTKDISAPPASKTTTTATGPYHPLATPPLLKTPPPPPNAHHTHHAGPSSTDVCCTSPDSGSNPTLSPSSTVSTSASPSSFGVPYALSAADPQHQHYQLPHGSGLAVASSTSCASCAEHTPAAAAASLAQSPPSAALPHANANASTAAAPPHPYPPIHPSTTDNTNTINSTNNPRIRHLLQLRRKHSRIDIEREMAEERERYGRRCSTDYGNGADGVGAGPGRRAPGGGGMLDVLEPRPRPGPGVRGSGGIGGIFEVLDG
ncbi:hypothetical protein IWX90DRAFT_486935 [Phyllosticta citrichinensis]|uniref:Uncharacterized protein n=1 Tax=Phyllosticta citrichinensis TaxID=1130410 RepID=A0ABR1XVA9_9PEZI